MNWYEIALGCVLIAVSLLIIVFTLAQEQKGQGLSAAIMGENSHMAPAVSAVSTPNSPNGPRSLAACFSWSRWSSACSAPACNRRKQQSQNKRVRQAR